MAARSVVALKGYVENGLGGVNNIYPADAVNNDAPEFVLQDTLANGDNTIIVPTNAQGCVIIFPPTATSERFVKGDAGDVGITVRPNGWFVLSFPDTPPASFLITITPNGGEPGPTTIIFF